MRDRIERLDGRQDPGGLDRVKPEAMGNGAAPLIE
jgi:hypothetical protein